MGKIIFWIVVFFLVLLALRLVSVHKTRQDERDRRDDESRQDNGSKPGKRDTRPAQEPMVKCSACGVFLPKSSSVMTPAGPICGDKDCPNKR